MKKIILASQSPRRRHLLHAMGLSFTVQPSNYQEKLDDTRSIEAVAIELALGKAQDIAARNPQAYVIGADTIVSIDNRQLEKPTDLSDARRMLESYAGKESQVSTGLAVVHLGKNITVTDVDTTLVYFKPDSPEVRRIREAYLQTGDWHDKAGGYGIQSIKNTLIDRIEGNYDTVIGLPTALLAEILQSIGIQAEAAKIDTNALYDD